MWSVIIFVTVLSVVCAAAAVLPRRRLAVEKGLAPRYETICGGLQLGAIGLGTATAIPFWRIAFYERFAVIAIFSPAVIAYSDFDYVTIRNRLLFSSITFRSRKNNLNFSAWVFSPREIVNILREHKVSVR